MLHTGINTLSTSDMKLPDWRFKKTIPSFRFTKFVNVNLVKTAYDYFQFPIFTFSCFLISGMYILNINIPNAMKNELIKNN